MRVVILAIGTRGDVEPALALAWQLRTQGHDVTMGVPEDLAGFARESSIEATAIRVNAREFLESPEGQKFLAAGNTREYVRLLVEKKHQIAPAVHEDLIKAVAGADVVVGTRLVEEEGASLSEWLGVPFVALHYAPVRANRAYANPFVTARRLPAALNVLTHRIFDQIQWRHNAPDVNVLRAKINLPPAKAPAAVRLARSKSLEIQAYSRHLLPELDPREARRPMVGYLRMRAEQRDLISVEKADAPLGAWLQSGEAPIYLGFGSQPVLDGEALVTLAREVSAMTGSRVLLNAGWSEVPVVEVDERVLIREGLNHDDVLPWCRAAVHHGGAGTTAASVGAGLPTVICADWADRALWGQVVRRRGIGDTTKFVGLTAQRLMPVLAPQLSAEPARRAQAIAAAMLQEDGAVTAGRLVEQLAEDPRGKDRLRG